MNRAMNLGAAAALIVTTSCAAPKLDTSTEDTFRQSAAIARDSLDSQLQTRFDEALKSIRLRAQKESEDGDEFSSDIRLRQMANGKTADEIIELGTTLELEEIASLRERVEEAESISRKISFSDVSFDGNMVRATSSNNTGHEVVYSELQIVLSDGTEDTHIAPMEKYPPGDTAIEMFVLRSTSVRFSPNYDPEPEPSVSQINLKKVMVIGDKLYEFPPLTNEESERLRILEERHGKND